MVDDWQGRGLGTLLLDVISAGARDEGTRIFRARTPENEEMMDVLSGSWACAQRRSSGRYGQARVKIPPVDVPPALQAPPPGSPARDEVAVALMSGSRTPSG